MTLKEIHAKAGSLPGYVGYIFLMAGWYFLDNLYTSNGPISPGSWLETLLEWAFRLMFVPLLYAGVYAGIHAQQQAQENWDLSGFFGGIKTHYWRLIAAQGVYWVVAIIVTMLATALGGVEQSDSKGDQLLLTIFSSIFSAINIFWFAGLVVERKVFRSLWHALKILLFNPYALVLGIAWGAIGFADTMLFDIPTGPHSIALDGLRAAVVGVARVLAAVYALAIYKQFYEKDLPVAVEEASPLETPASAPGDGLVNTGFAFALFSFLPLVHLVALTLGLIAILRKKRLGLRSVIACGFGGFFTLFYALVLLGWVINWTVPAPAADYAFLAETNAELQPQVRLLEQGAFQEAQQQLEQATPGANTSWASDCALALAQLYSRDLDGALENFRLAAEKKPGRAEFYYFYGVALLEDNQKDVAKAQFQAALAHDPAFDAAQRYLSLLTSAYEPSKVVSALLFIIYLMILFSVHEYGHAFIAWKLGDDTAEQLGRLTLNPLRHLDLFGSIILPGILIMQESGMVFGWAKPVPVDPRNFKNPQKDHMRVAFAGPAVNLLVSMACFVLLAGILFFTRLFWPETLSLNYARPYAPVSIVGPSFAHLLTIIVVFIKQLFYFSLVLGCLNLIPIPPLDGSWILSGLLPQNVSIVFEKIRPYAYLIFLLLAWTPVMGYFLSIPIEVAWGGLETLVYVLGLG